MDSFSFNIILAIISLIALLFWLFALRPPIRPRPIIASTMITAISYLFYLMGDGSSPLAFPRHAIVVFECEEYDFKDINNALKRFTDLKSFSLVGVQDESVDSGCQSSASEKHFSPLDIATSESEWSLYVGLTDQVNCPGQNEHIVQNKLSCAIDTSLSRLGWQARLREPLLIVLSSIGGTLDIKTNPDDPEVNDDSFEQLLRFEIPIFAKIKGAKHKKGLKVQLFAQNPIDTVNFTNTTSILGRLSAPSFSSQNLNSLSVEIKGSTIDMAPGCDSLVKTQPYPFKVANSPGRRKLWWSEDGEDLLFEFKIMNFIELITYKSKSRMPCDGWRRISANINVTMDSGEKLEFPTANLFIEQREFSDTAILIGEHEGQLSEKTWMQYPQPSPQRVFKALAEQEWGYYENIGGFSNLGWHNYGFRDDGKGCHVNLQDIMVSDDRDKLNQCLYQSELILLFAPSKEQIEYLENEINLSGILQNNEKSLVVTLPPSGTKNEFPEWITPTKKNDAGEPEIVHGDNRLIIIPDRSHLVRRAGANGVIQKQQQIINGLVADNSFIQCGGGAKPAIVDTDPARSDFGLVPNVFNKKDWPSNNKILIEGPEISNQLSPFTSPGGFSRSLNTSFYLNSQAAVQIHQLVTAEKLKEPWAGTLRENTHVLLFNSSIYQIPIEHIGTGVSLVESNLRDFFSSKAKVILVEIPLDPKNVDTNKINTLLENNYPGGFDKPLDLLKSMANKYGGNESQIITARLDSDDILTKLKTSKLFVTRAGYGHTFDEEHECNVGDNDYEKCADAKRIKQRKAPERYQPLNVDLSPMSSGHAITSGAAQIVVAQKRYYSSRIHTLGYSPLARDFLEKDTIQGFGPGKKFIDGCFLTKTAEQPVLSEFRNDFSSLPDGWGPGIYLDIFRKSSHARSPRPGQIADIQQLQEGGILDVYLWNDGKISLADIDVSEGFQLIPVSFDPQKQQTHFRLLRTDDSVNNPMTPIKLADSLIAAHLTTQPKPDLPTAFWTRLVRMSGGQVLDDKSPLSIPHTYGVASTTVLLFGLLLLLYSPVARNWLSFQLFLENFYSRVLGKRRQVNLPPLFEVDAVLNEWGTNPGKPKSGRHAGLPGGRRTFSAGDTMSNVNWSDLAGLIYPNENYPVKKPQVKLKTQSQSRESLIFLDDSGSLLSPRAVSKPAKSDFAVRLTTLISAALRREGGVSIHLASAEVPVMSLEPDSDLNQFESQLLTLLRRNQRVSDLNNTDVDISSRYIVYVLDPIGNDCRQLIKFAERIASESGRLVLFAITSDDDLSCNRMVKDIRSGSLFDRSEWTPAQIKQHRENSIADLREKISRYGATLSVFDTGITSSELVNQIRELDLL